MVPDLLGPLVLFVGGIVLIIVSWFVVSAQVSFASQITYVNLAIGGAVLSASGAVIYLMNARRNVRSRIDRLAEQLDY